MARHRIVEGDTVVVTALGSKYRGKRGVVRSFTDSKKSARLTLQDGSKHTLRVDGLELAVSQAVPVKKNTEHRDHEVQQLRKELNAMRKVLQQLVKLMEADTTDSTDAKPHLSGLYEPMRCS